MRRKVSNRTTRQRREATQVNLSWAAIICTLLAFACALVTCGMVDAHCQIEAVAPVMIAGGLAFWVAIALLITASEA